MGLTFAGVKRGPQKSWQMCGRWFLWGPLVFLKNKHTEDSIASQQLTAAPGENAMLATGRRLALKS